jgi:hypothetical protein
MVLGKCFAIRVVVGMNLTQQSTMMSISNRLPHSRCHHTIHIGFFLGKPYTAATVAVRVFSPSVAGATQVPTSASVLASLTGVIDQHITNVESAKTSSFLGELCNVLGN